MTVALGSAAHEAGLQVGDSIVQVNGAATLFVEITMLRQGCNWGYGGGVKMAMVRVGIRPRAGVRNGARGQAAEIKMFRRVARPLNHVAHQLNPILTRRHRVVQGPRFCARLHAVYGGSADTPPSAKCYFPVNTPWKVRHPLPTRCHQRSPGGQSIA